MAGIINTDSVSGVISSSTTGVEELFDDITRASAVFSMGRNIGPMPKGKTKIPIPSKLITAGFVNGNTGVKPVTDAALTTPELTAGKIAAIVLIPQDVLDDADIDLWESWIKPAVPEAFGAALDAAALFGSGAPTDWTGFQQGLVAQAVAKTSTVTQTANIYNDIMAKNGIIHKVNANGYKVTGFVGDTDVEADLRSAVDGNGRPLFNPYLDPISGEPKESIYGKRYFSLENGAWDNEDALLVGGDFTKLIYSIRKEIEYRISTEATVTLPDNTVVNCFQQNVVAFLMEMRVGAAVLAPVNRKNQANANRFPFAILKKAAV